LISLKKPQNVKLRAGKIGICKAEDYMTKIDISKLHTTEMGIERIKRNLNLATDDMLAWCQQAILNVDND
jgi:hypothetical protein